MLVDILTRPGARTGLQQVSGEAPPLCTVPRLHASSFPCSLSIADLGSEHGNMEVGVCMEPGGQGEKNSSLKHLLCPRSCADVPKDWMGS